MKALTANRLLDGEVVFWRDGAWVEQFADAQRWDDPTAAAEAETAGKAQVTVVIDAYLIDLQPGPDGVDVPVSYRERIRALGPTNHLHFGKQTEGGPVLEAIAHASGAARSTGRLALIRRK